MPFNISGRKPRLLAAAVGLAATLAAAGPAQANRQMTNPGNCAPEPTLDQNFAPWGDDNQYTPVANAGFEQGSAGWQLSGGANITDGSEARMSDDSDTTALDLPAGSSATTEPICIDETYPHFRFFVRNAGALNAALKIEVLYFDTKGRLAKSKHVNYRTDATDWEPTEFVGIDVFDSKATVEAAPVAFRFTAISNKAHFQIDDVYVDPRARG